MTIADLKPGQHARVSEVGGEGALRQHFLDMGVIPGASLMMVKPAPLGDPLELRIHGYELTLRLADAAKITVVSAEDAPAEEKHPSVHVFVPHEGLQIFKILFTFLQNTHQYKII